MSNKQAEMEEVSVTTLIEKYNLIIPEIQREYVWGNNDYGILGTFLDDIKEGYKIAKRKRQTPTDQYKVLKEMFEASDDSLLKEALQASMDKLVQPESMNIGFLYSYRPDYYVFDDATLDVYLIDGQQRFTTLFLLLFYLSVKEGKSEEFKHMFRFNAAMEHIAFDYRVRSLTHNFIIDLISKTDTLESLLSVKLKNWFLSDYANDVTVQSIVGKVKESGAFNVIHKNFEQETDSYFDYVRLYVKFWHFKTEETTQGEELYITMNSRGQQLSDNENIRAKLFETDIAKKNSLHWSEQWENWQDFFWKKRSRKTADAGFNEFLRWVQILEIQHLRAKTNEKDKLNAFEKELTQTIRWNVSRRLDVRYLSLEKIDEYFKILQFLYTDFKNLVHILEEKYPGYDNFDLLSENWLKAEQSNISQIECFVLLPVLYYCQEKRSAKLEDAQTLFRLVRFFYNLSKNETIQKTAPERCLDAFDLVQHLPDKDICSILDEANKVSITLLSNEEAQKLRMYRYPELDSNREQYETLFWQGEDTRLNDGSIGHLIDLAKKEADESGLFIEIFKTNLHIYQELIDKYEEIWGNLIATSIYIEEGERLYRSYKWHQNADFLHFLIDRRKFNGSLNSFLLNKQRAFILQYPSCDDIAKEHDIKKQIFIYFIIRKNILKNWNWHQRWNFGFYRSNNIQNSIFDNKYTIQTFSLRFVWNYDYYIWKSAYEDNRNYFEELMNWAKQ